MSRDNAESDEVTTAIPEAAVLSVAEEDDDKADEEEEGDEDDAGDVIDAVVASSPPDAAVAGAAGSSSSLSSYVGSFFLNLKEGLRMIASLQIWPYLSVKSFINPSVILLAFLMNIMASQSDSELKSSAVRFCDDDEGHPLVRMVVRVCVCVCVRVRV